MDTRFIVDINAGKLAKWLRIIGYDTLLFNELDDGQMARIALQENRIILTKDTQFLKRKVITGGKVKALLVEGEDPREQLEQVVSHFKLDYEYNPFSICIECNCPLVSRPKNELKDIVPPYVFKTQDNYMECPRCHRIYWKGTHWQSMSRELDEIIFSNKKK